MQARQREMRTCLRVLKHSQSLMGVTAMVMRRRCQPGGRLAWWWCRLMTALRRCVWKALLRMLSGELCTPYHPC